MREEAAVKRRLEAAARRARVVKAERRQARAEKRCKAEEEEEVVMTVLKRERLDAQFALLHSLLAPPAAGGTHA